MSDKSASGVISLPQGGGALQGMGEKFSPDLHTGTGNFSVPIALPPGRNGFQPQLTLAYSTGAGNGPFGLGWNVTVPGVRRKTSAGIPRYDDANDVFVLSGSEDLVPVPGADPGSTRYRPRTEGLFARILRRHDASDDYWEVATKDGQVSRYGTPGSSGDDPGAVAKPDDRSRVFAWLLTSTRDPLGNLILYDYERDTAEDGPHCYDQLYLKRIRYADYPDGSGSAQFLISVSFTYEDRPDPFSDYRAGFEVRTRQRCSKIEVRTHAGQDRLVRTFDLTYLDQRPEKAALLPPNGVSLLSQVQVTGHGDNGATESLPPLELTYTRFEPESRDFFPVGGDGLPADALDHPDLELADLFANGLPDLLETHGTVRYYRNRGDGTFDVPREMRQAPAGLKLADPGVQMIDADGDGRTDLMVTRGTLSGYFPLRSEGLWDEGSFRRYPQAPSFNLEDPNVRLVDLDGDGVTDALRTGTRLECFFNHPEKGWHRARFVERQALDAFPNVSFADPRLKLADMTGGGLQDVVLIHDGSIEYWPSLGHGDWGKPVTMQNSPRFPYGYDPRRILLGDVDGDGLADLLYVGDTQVTLWINQSGNAWSEPVVIQGTPPVSDTDAVRLVDLLGNGVSGVLWSSEASATSRARLHFLDLTGGTKPYLLHEMDNHLGAITRVEYAPSTRFYLEDEKRPETRWKTSLPFPVQVVARVESIDAISGGKLTSEYVYHHGYWDGAERELRGFGRVDQRDTEEFDRYHASGLHPEGAFEPIAPERFSPPTEVRNFFHQGPVGDAASDWEEADLAGEHWAEDPQVLERPAAVDALLADLPRRDRRDALRALRGSVLRTELYALDASPRQERPVTVSETLFGLREESPPGPGEEERRRIFYPHVLAQRTTEWERGEEPMTKLTFTDGHDRYGQPLSQTSVAVPRGRDPYRALQPDTAYPAGSYDLTFTDLVGAELDGAVLRKTVPMGWGNAGATSLNTLNPGEDGWVEASTAALGSISFFGLTRIDPEEDHQYQSVEYGVLFSRTNAALIYEKGQFVKGLNGIGTSDVIRIERVGQTVYYKHDGNVFHTSAVPSATELVADVVLYDPESAVTNLKFSKPAPPPFLATHEATDYAEQAAGAAGALLADRVARTTSWEVVEAGARDAFALHAGVLDGSAARRLVGQELHYYDGPAFAGLPFGRLGAHGLPSRSESLVLTEEILQEAYGTEIPPYLDPSGPPAWTAEAPQEFRDLLPPLAGYVFHDGTAEHERGYFAAEGLRYDVHEDPAGRGLLTTRRGPLGEETATVHDAYGLLPAQTTDAAGLVTSVTYDPWTLQPAEATDPNGNRLAFTYTPLGLPETTAVLGKEGQDEGDTPESPGLRWIYDFTAFAERGQPVSVRTVQRLHHANDTAVPLPERDETIESVEYTDGFQRLLQKRAQADDVVFGGAAFGDSGLAADAAAPLADTVGTQRTPGDPPAVVVTGWQRYDNKGRPVETYEPFFAEGWDYAPPSAAQTGRSVTTCYDARGEVVRTVHPDGSELRAVHGVPADLTDPEVFTPTPWEVYTYDESDNAGRTHGSGDPAPWNTPSSAVVDALGRTVESVERLGPDPASDWNVIRSTFDVRGNQLTVTDPMGRLASAAVYDLAKNALRSEHYDSGVRRSVLDAAGGLVEQRDAKGGLVLRAHDAAKRPVRLWARDESSEAVVLRERLVYGDAADSGLDAATARASNLLGVLYQHYDEAGLLVHESYDMKDNLREKVRFPLSDAAVLSAFDPPPAGWEVETFRVDWQPPAGTDLATHAAALLDPTEYRTSVSYDAVHRARTLLYPRDVDGGRKEARPTYNRGGELVRIELDGTCFVERIAYNAKGSRTLVAYGNGLMTRKVYDPQTFRLARLRTERYASPTAYTYHPSDPGQPLQDAFYTYDLAGNLVTLVDRAPGSGVLNNPDAAAAGDPDLAQALAAGDALIRRFTYDPLHRLTSASGRECDLPPAPPPWADAPRGTDLSLARRYSEQYQYDALGNLLTLHHDSDGTGTNRQTGLVAGNNRLATLTVGQIVYDYAHDGAGHLIREGTSRHFEWDHAGRMRSFRTQTAGAEPSVHAHYFYDSAGERVKKLVRKQGGRLEVTVYVDAVFEHHRVVENASAQENNTLHVLDGMSRIAAVRVGAAFPGDASPATAYHLGDHLGSSQVVADGAGGFVNREEHTPYGETSFGSYARKRYRFTGKERDEESGLYYHGARYYAPWLARWSSPDPAGTVDGLSLYLYALANPLRMVDPEGTQAKAAAEEPTPSSADVCHTNHHERPPAKLDAGAFEDLGVQPVDEKEALRAWVSMTTRPKKSPPKAPKLDPEKVDMPFPHMFVAMKEGRIGSQTYVDALVAWSDFQQVEAFLPYWAYLNQAAQGVVFTVDGISVSKRSQVSLFVDESAKSARGVAEGRVKDVIMGPKGAVAFDMLMMLNDVRQVVKRERLANYADHKMDATRARLALSYVMTDLAQKLASRYGGSPMERENWLRHQYQRFSRIHDRYSVYTNMEYNLNPKNPQGPAAWPAP